MTDSCSVLLKFKVKEKYSFNFFQRNYKFSYNSISQAYLLDIERTVINNTVFPNGDYTIALSV